MTPEMTIIDLGRLAYRPAYERQVEHLQEVLAAREAGAPEVGRVLMVEHEPVVTIGRRPGAASHLVASPDLLARSGVSVEETDRGGDVTYHGPGQLVVYPIVDLNELNLGLHEYMRLLEQAVIETLGRFGVRGRRDPGATGVWVGDGPDAAKVCAMGVRVRRWITMHGLALNVAPNMAHFGLIVPCGLVGRPVTSMQLLLGAACPSMDEVKVEVTAALRRGFLDAHAAAVQKRAAAAEEARSIT